MNNSNSNNNGMDSNISKTSRKASNIITVLAKQIRTNSVETQRLKAFIVQQMKQMPSASIAQDIVPSSPVSPSSLVVPEAYDVAHSLFERMTEERLLAKAIVEEPEAWDYPNEESAKRSAEELLAHAEDFRTVAEELLVIAWNGYYSASLA